MTKIWNNIKKSFNNQDTIKFLIVLLFLVICIVLFILIQQQDNTMNNLVNISKETFTTTDNITILIDGKDITNYNQDNKLKLQDGNYEFTFTLENIKNITINRIDFVNISGNYQNVKLDKNDLEIIEKNGENSANNKKIQFTQFLNLDTEYKMIVSYSNNEGSKRIENIIYTSMELNYIIPAGGRIEEDILNLEVKYNNVDGIFVGVDDSGLNENIPMQQFNYVSFSIIKPNLNKLRVKLLETEFDNDDVRKEYLKKLQQFDKLVPLKFDASLTLIKDIGSSNISQYISFSESDLRNHRKDKPIPERIILPNPNCSSNNCELQIRNVVEQAYSLKVRLEYYYLDNIRNIRATPYLEFKFKVMDNGGTNSFSISKLNIVGKLEENQELKNKFDTSQKEQDTNLDKIENDFKNLLQ